MDSRTTVRLTPNVRLVLASLHRTQRPMYAYELSKDLHLPVNVVLGTFHRLESAGCVRHVDEPVDAPPQSGGWRPRVWFELTPEGKDFAATTVSETHSMALAQARSIGLNLGR